MHLLNVSVTPAQPGHYLIYKEDDGTYDWWGQVIAWRVTTWQLEESTNRMRSDVEPLEVDGEPAGNCVGVKNPDGSVVLFHDRTFGSWAEFSEYAEQQRAQPV